MSRLALSAARARKAKREALEALAVAEEAERIAAERLDESQRGAAARRRLVVEVVDMNTSPQPAHGPRGTLPVRR